MSPGRARRAGGAALFGALVCLSCTERRATPSTATEPSPNASILPAPLASAADLGSTGQAGATAAAESASAIRALSGDPEPPPEAAPTDQALPVDTNGARDAAAYTMEAAFRWSDTPPIPLGPEVPATLKDVAARLELKVGVDLSSNGRMRFSLESEAFPLPIHTELRARTSYYGNVLVWPDGKTYRVVPAGSLRALFAERRADVEPLLRAVLRAGGSGSLLGHRTVQTELETSLGVLLLEQATISGGTAGELLCRLLVELVGAEPTNDACRPERVPLFAQWRWTGGGSMAFAATSIGDRKDPSSVSLAVPPDGARWAPGELPASTSTLLTPGELSRLKSRPMRAAVPNAKVTEGVTFSNETNLTQYLFLDGVPVMWLLPHSREHLPGPPAGKYQVGFRDFLGTAVTAPSVMELPAFVRVGIPEADAGARL